jgi:hypothetical protein
VVGVVGGSANSLAAFGPKKCEYTLPYDPPSAGMPYAVGALTGPDAEATVVGAGPGPAGLGVGATVAGGGLLRPDGLDADATVVGADPAPDGLAAAWATGSACLAGLLLRPNSAEYTLPREPASLGMP